MEQDVRPRRQLERRLRIEPRLVVRHERERAAGLLEAVADRPSRMADRGGGDRKPVDDVTVVPDLDELDASRYALERDGKERR